MQLFSEAWNALGSLVQAVCLSGKASLTVHICTKAFVLVFDMFCNVVAWCGCGPMLRHPPPSERREKEGKQPAGNVCGESEVRRERLRGID